MDDKTKEKKNLYDNIIDSENIKNNTRFFNDYSNNKNNHIVKFSYKLSSTSPKNKYLNHSFTERKYKYQEYKENINNNGNNEDKKFIRLKKGLHYRIKNKTSRNYKNTNENKEIIDYKNQQKNEKNYKENLFPKEIGRKSQILSHSFSYDYLNINSDLGFKFQPSIQNEKILSKNFVKGMKNQKRKNELINAIEKYNKYKTLFSSKSERQMKSKNDLDKYDNESENESIEKRLEQINKIKIQNIINYKKLYESIKNRKDIKSQKRKVDNSQEKNHKEIFIRKILREEKYTIGDDGKEKILEINQSFLPNKINIESIDNIKSKDNEDEKKEGFIKNEENYRQIIQTEKNIINVNKNNNSNTILQKRRSYQNLNKNLNQIINENKNKIFIKKHPTNLKINDSSKLNNNKIINQRSINKTFHSNYIVLDNNNRNHSYREIKNLTENNKNQKNSNISFKNQKLLNINIDGDNEIKNNIISNKNNYISNNQRKDQEKNKYKFFTNRIYNSKGFSNNNFIHEIISKENKIGSKQFIMFNLNNFNDSNKNQNNNVITIYTSPNYK